MTAWEATALVLVAVLGAGGPLAMWISTRSARASTTVAARSIDTIEEVARRLGSMETTMQSVVDTVSNTSRRLDGHDREFGAHNRRISQLEQWRAQFHVDDDDRLNPPPTAKEAS